MLTQLLAIIRNTFVESLRQPITIVLIIAGALCQWISTANTSLTMDDDDVMFVQVGLSILVLIGLPMAAFIATGVLSLEVENKTVLTVVSKPVTRPLFILGKFIGVTAALSVAMWPVIMIYLLCVQHGVMQTASHTMDGPVVVFGAIAFLGAILGSVFVNYMYRRPFVSTCVASMAALMTVAWVLTLFLDKSWNFHGPAVEFAENEGLLVNVMIGLLLFYQVLAIFSAVAIVVSTRLGQVLTIIITVIIGFFMSVMESMLGGIVRMDTADAGLAMKLVQWIATAVYHVVPNLKYLWLADDLSIGLTLSGTYVWSAVAYSFLFMLALLALAVALFQTREVG